MALQNNTRIRQQRRQRIMIVITMLMLALVAAVVFFWPKPKPVNAEQRRPPGMIGIPVAKNDIPMGTRINTMMVRISYLKPSEVPVDAILSPKEFIGRFTKRPILASEYFQESDITEPGAHAGFTGVAKPGMRIVHVNANLFPGSLKLLRAGDRIDLLSIEASAGQSATVGGASSAALEMQASSVWGGQHPGDSKARANAKAAMGGAAIAAAPRAVTATLIAENAEVMYVPREANNRGAKGNEAYVVLQMTPEDAHVTVLASTIGNTMRVVFRPFSDDTRLTPVKEVKVTTRLPKPSKDPENITIINGLQRRQQKPFSETYRNDSESSERLRTNEDILVLKNSDQQSNKAESQGLNLYGEY